MIVQRPGVSRATRSATWPSALMLALLALGCSSTTVGGKQQQHPVLVSTPVTLGEGDTGKPARESDPAAEVPEREESAGSLPDPRPLATPDQWEIELHLRQGEITVERAERRIFERPVVTPRMMGRFAFELWIGRELIDRVRFDFPLLGAEVPAGERRSLHEAPRFGPGLDARRTILVPDSPRATRAQLTDRATGAVQSIAWPPDAPLERTATPPESANEQ